MKDEPWYNVFSYWSIVLALLSPWLPFPVLVIMIANLVGTILLISISKPALQVQLYLIVLHVLPVWFLRKQPIQLTPAISIFMVYLFVLDLQGTNIINVYKNLFDNPPQSVREVLKRRGIISA